MKRIRFLQSISPKVSTVCCVKKSPNSKLLTVPQGQRASRTVVASEELTAAAPPARATVGHARRRRDGGTQSERRAEGAADGNFGCVSRVPAWTSRFRRVASRLVLNVVALILTRSSLPLPRSSSTPGNVEMPNVNKFPSSKLKLDEFFLNWLSSQDSQKLVRPRPPGSRGPSVFSILPQLSLARETRPDEERRFRRDAVRPVVPFGRVVPKACPPALTHFRAPERPHRIAGAGLAGGRQGG